MYCTVCASGVLLLAAAVHVIPANALHSEPGLHAPTLLGQISRRQLHHVQPDCAQIHVDGEHDEAGVRSTPGRHRPSKANNCQSYSGLIRTIELTNSQRTEVVE